MLRHMKAMELLFWHLLQDGRNGVWATAKRSFLRASFFLLVFFNAERAAADGMTNVVVDGEELRGVKRVVLGANGKVSVIYSAGGSSIAAEKLPPEFLQSWGITPEKVGAAKQADFERALNQGQFRIVDGIVYDLRQKQAGWTYFQNVKLTQKLLSGAALVDPSPDRLNIAVIHVLNLPDTVSDTERFSFAAKQVGTYEYENKLGNIRVVRSYDAGRVCSRSEIPDAILKEGKPFAALASSSALTRSVTAQLPESDDLVSSGTGFFITDDGYLVTNYHVVRGKSRVKVKNRQGVFDAAVVRSDEDADLALLKAEGAFKALPLSLVQDASLGSEVFTIGFPNIISQGIEPKYTDGKISSLTGLHDDPSQYQISVPIQPGNSGGPLVDTSGQVVGVVVARMNDLRALVVSGSVPQNVNYAIKASGLRAFLKRASELSGRLKKTPPAGTRREEAIHSAEDGTVLVLCYK